MLARDDQQASSGDARDARSPRPKQESAHGQAALSELVRSRRLSTRAKTPARRAKREPRLQREGKVIRIKNFESKADALEAAGVRK